jgi:hypothetical protein
LKGDIVKTILAEEGYSLSLFDTYLAQIKGSVGSNQYRKLFVTRPEGVHEVIENGDLACAYFVSAILTLCNLMRDGVHTTVTATITDLEASGWKLSPKLKVGSVVIWKPKLCTDGLQHRHIGFYIGGKMAVSNVAKLRTPAVHHVTYQGTRQIEAIYFHHKLH